MNVAANDPESAARLAAFVQGLQELGWTEGRNLGIDIRWSAGDADRTRISAGQLAALAPDVILAIGGTVVGPLLEASRTVPVVFTQTADPVGSGFVASLARPGGNITGFTNIEPSIGGKWLELLKEIAPSVARAAIIYDATIAGSVAEFAMMQVAGCTRYRPRQPRRNIDQGPNHFAKRAMVNQAGHEPYGRG